MYDVIIVGSGPAGLFSAYNLVKNKVRSILIIDKNPFPSGGMLNDCKLNLTPDIGMELDDLFLTRERALELIKEIDSIFLKFNAPKELYGENAESYKEWVERAKRNDALLVGAIQRHIGTDLSKDVIKSFRKYLEGEGVSFTLSTNIENVEQENSGFELTSDNNQDFHCRNLILAPGRSGSKWLRDISKKIGIKYSNGKRIDVGIRIEMRRESYPITDLIYDPKFKIKTKYSNELRTFCTNPGGRVTLEHYDDFKLVNGDALKNKKTENTNFALLNTVNLTEPLTDPFVYGRLIASATNILGGGLPIVQRVGDFLDEKRSKGETFFDSSRWYDRVIPTLSVGNTVTPGDIRMAYPYKIVKSLKEGLIKLNKIFGNTILKEENLIYGPEIKFYSLNYETDKNMETNIENLFVAGDGAGKSRGIVGAAISGVIASEGILKKWKI
ncbi:MAG: FAD/NAD(P)-binding protein [bacterium]|nr:FAD/NAD(P)-binding protein [bacterium]